MAQERKQLATTIERASWWSITINNPTESDRSLLEKANLPSWVKAVHYQDEVGDEGTLHIQGAVNTAQVRFSAMKGWLPRAHIEIARNKEALLKYVQKAETAVTGTQVVLQADYLSMDAALKAIAVHEMHYGEWVLNASAAKRAKDGAFEKEEFWSAVRKILLENPKAVGLFTNPQLERAWINTRSVWIALVKKDRQTDSQSAVENSPDESNDIV